MKHEAGKTVVLQEVWRDRVWAARPMRVVEDDGDRVALWFPRGTWWKAPTDGSGRSWDGDRGERLAECAARGEWSFRDLEWDVDTLSLMREGDWHALWVSWLPGGEHWGWYVNLQRPFRRTELGFETMDLALDVLVDPDRSWRWKDEDELETFVEHGVFDRSLAERIRTEALEVVERARNDEPPFSDPWPEWRPDPSWDLPELPEGWDVVCR
jgi:Protein of unknown function (DUF402)